MKTLGIVYGHDATVCLVDDGRVVFCQSEERLNRLKGSGGFPSRTLEYVYEHITPSDSIDLAVLYEREFEFQYSRLKQLRFEPTRAGYLAEHDPIFKDRTRPYLRGLKDLVIRTGIGRALHERRRLHVRASHLARSAGLRGEALAYFAGALRLPAQRVCGLDHHLAHAYGCVANIQDWGATLIFTLDGWGDGKCATVGRFENGKLASLSSSDEIHSLGTYYRFTTLILGLRALEDEYKVMGLAAYADPARYRGIVAQLRSLIRINDGGGWESLYSGRALFAALERIYHLKRFDHVAGAIQQLSEQLVVEWIEYWIRKTGCRRIALAGGLFMNVKISQRVTGMECVDRVFVMPAAADESAAIGCAIWGQLRGDSSTRIEPLQHLYLGMEFPDSAIERAIDETEAGSRYTITRPVDMNRAVATLLAHNHVVARYSGRMEFGPRALGNRSILANPKDVRIATRINNAIKSRDFWMPFAPSILEEDMARYVRSHERVFAPYMCVAFDSTEEARNDLAAAIHPRDFTIRPQAVRREWNHDYHEIIACFKQQTGVGGILNTSFNLHGEPIVGSPWDAIRAVDGSGLDHLALGPYLLAKRLDGEGGERR